MLGKLYTIGSDTGGGQHQTHDKGRNVTGQNADQNRGRAEEARGPVLEDQNDHQYEQGQQKISMEPKSFALLPPPKELIPTEISERPMESTTVPVTTGGKNLRRGLRKKPSTLSKMPPMMDAPIMHHRPAHRRPCCRQHC